MASFFETVWNGWLRQPYTCAKVTDTGSGDPVILLHGLGRSAQVWKHIIPLLEKYNRRIVAFDLLGFGSSPKPDIPYNIDDHARAIIKSIEKLKLTEQTVLVGHSMGCLVAVRVARLRPDLVRHLVLYEMPLYEGLPEKRTYKIRTDLYFKLYERIVQYQPTFNKETAKFAERTAVKIAGFEVTRDTWQPFIRSIKNTIMRQTAAEDIKQLSMPMDVIYGTYDMLVIRGKKQQVFGTDSKLIEAHTIRARHSISPKASAFIVSRISAALEHPIQ
ncbi:MAG: alpha/beta hydrolase [Patescibacteria group bacterium]|nr:alpha/beta hydrolase [Patescibacteria group bacterium]